VAATKTKGRKGGVDQRLVKALGHPIRVQALTILNERVASPNELAKELEEGLSQVSYHVKVLKECDCLELVKVEPRRGAVEHYYRATSRAALMDLEFEQLPPSVRRSLSATLLQNVVEDAAEAITTGSFDRRDDRHLSWTPVILDEEGWNEACDVLAQALQGILSVQANSAARLSESDEAGFSATMTIMGYEAPGGKRKVGPPKGV
jgi:DNA-binding transcriptional ArsR family regulator